MALINTTEWSGLKPGDECKVAGKKGHFKFQAHVRNDVTGAEWINVFGGTANRERARSFPVDRVVRAPRRRTRHYPTVTEVEGVCA